MGALADLRVVEVAGGVGLAYAAKLFADLGADVVRVETDDDVVRHRPHEVHRWLNTSKRSMRRTPTVVADLLAGAQLLLHDLGPTAASAAGLDADELLGARPDLVVGSFTPYGMTGPWADFAGTELNVIHACSWGNLSPGAASDKELPPLKAPGHHASLLGATVAATAFLAAVDRAERTGIGEHVDASAFAIGAKLCETSPASVSFLGVDSSRVGVRSVVPWSIYRCRDGLLQFICVEDAQWKALVQLMGEPEWAMMDIFATNVDRQANADLVELYLSEWMATQSAVDLYRRGQQARICVAPVSTMDQLAQDEQLQARGFFADDGAGLLLPGAGYRMDQPSWWSLTPAPELGAHDGEAWRSEPPADRTVPVAAPAAGAGRPLDGVKVCDFTWIWAGPYCTQLLAHLGADVVRIESPEHLCLFRRLLFHPPELEATPDSNGLFQLYNSDKRSIGLDLRHAAARDVVLRLVAQSDVVVENFAVGALAALGFGVEDLRAVNPDVIVVSLTGFGQDGPSAGYMAYGPSGGAVAGLYAANGYEGGTAAETGIAIGDPGTGLTGAWATVAALVARRRTGIAARVDVAMVEAIAATVGELWMQRHATGTSPVPSANRDPQWAPHGVYATGEDEWVTIACTTDAQWQALATLAGWHDDRFATAEGRKQHEAELDELVSGWVAGQDRWALCRRLQAAGVAAMPSLSPMQLWRDNEQLAAIGMLERPQHPVTGARVVPGVPWRLTNGANGLRRPAPCLGQHTDEVLAELGFAAGEIDGLRRAGALRELPAPHRAPEPAGTAD